MATVEDMAGYRPSTDVAWDPAYLDLGRRPAVLRFDELDPRGELPADALLSPVALTLPFPILTGAGVEAARPIVEELARFATGDARSRRLRGLTECSAFFAGMYADPGLLAFLSALAEAELRPHPMWNHRVQLNYPPEDLERAVDVWHYDAVAFDFVMLLTDPVPMRGGTTEYFAGTVAEGQRILDTASTLPEDRVVRIAYPAAGWGFLQQGHQVLHRVAPLEEPYPRVSLVASYSCSDPTWREPSSSSSLTLLRRADGVDTALRQWAAYTASRSAERLARFVDAAPWTGRPLADVRAELRDALEEARRAVDELADPDEGAFVTSVGDG
ncbi:MAG: HalD/BesD family halogenase [Acidimicrobiales bacterium]